MKTWCLPLHKMLVSLPNFAYDAFLLFHYTEFVLQFYSVSEISIIGYCPDPNQECPGNILRAYLNWFPVCPIYYFCRFWQIHFLLSLSHTVIVEPGCGFCVNQLLLSLTGVQDVVTITLEKLPDIVIDEETLQRLQDEIARLQVWSAGCHVSSTSASLASFTQMFF